MSKIPKTTLTLMMGIIFGEARSLNSPDRIEVFIVQFQLR
jgi:hypothetical protein